MATEQILTSQIVGYSPGTGAQIQTKFITLSGGTADVSTTAFSFVVGMVMIELLHDNPTANNGIDVYSVLWANMRSFNGTKTADVTNRTAKGPGNGGFLKIPVDRTTSGTILVLSQPSDGTQTTPANGGVSSLTTYNWPTVGMLRITAIEDTQA